jgi:hypothetical protein
VLYLDELKKDSNQWVKYDPTTKLHHSFDDDTLLEGGESRKHRSNDHRKEESSIEKE